MPGACTPERREGCEAPGRRRRVVLQLSQPTGPHVPLNVLRYLSGMSSRKILGDLRYLRRQTGEEWWVPEIRRGHIWLTHQQAQRWLVLIRVLELGPPPGTAPASMGPNAPK